MSLLVGKHICFYMYCVNNSCTARCTVSCISTFWPPYWFYYLVVIKSLFSFSVIPSTKEHFHSSSEEFISAFNNLKVFKVCMHQNIGGQDLYDTATLLFQGLVNNLVWNMWLIKKRAHIVKSPSFNHVSGGVKVIIIMTIKMSSSKNKKA